MKRYVVPLLPEFEGDPSDDSGGDAARHMSRRQFLKGLSLGTAGLLIGPHLLGRGNASAQSTDLPKAVVVHNPEATAGGEVIVDVVESMLDEAVMTLTGEPMEIEAWQRILPGLTPDEVIGIKVNCASNQCPSRPEVALAIAERISQIEIDGEPFPINNIIIWERTDFELSRAGYTINDGSEGVRCFGTNHTGVGYDYSYPITVSEKICYPSTILSRLCDRIINLCVLKDHNLSGFTLTLKNHFGSINNPIDLHGGSGNPYLATLNNCELIRRNEVLSICDALFGIWQGGPSGAPQIWETYPEGTPNTLILSTDPIAVEHEGARIINTERESRGYGIIDPAYLHTAVRIGVGARTLTQGRRNLDRKIHEHKEGSASDQDVMTLIRAYVR
jgi:uncharacterized protein (DUF362 family)